MLDSFQKRIQITVDLVTAQAKKGVTDFRKAVADADGPVNKLRAGAGTLGASLRGIPFSVVAAGALSAGAATAKFAVDAVNRFANVAVAAKELGTATGLSTEAASRWIAVGDDFGVSAETLQTSLGRLAKAAGTTPEKFEKFGVTIARTESGAVDMNATFLNTIQRLQEIQDPAQRAAAGAALLGKGWQSLAPILENTRGELESMLGAVEAGQVITDAEADRAREWKLALDNLQDTVGELGLELGGTLAPVLTDIADGMSDLVKFGRGVGDVFSKIGDGLDRITPGNGLDDLVRSMPGGSAVLGLFGDKAEEATHQTDQLSGSTAAMAEHLLGAADAAGQTAEQLEDLISGTDILDQQAANTRALGDAWAAAEGDITGAMDAAAEAAERNEEALRGMNDAYRESLALNGDVDRATDDFIDSVNSLAEDMQKATEAATDDADANRNRGLVLRDSMDKGLALAKALEDQARAEIEATGATIDLATETRLANDSMLRVASTVDGPVRDALLHHITSINNIPEDVATEIVAAVAAGDLARAEQLLDDATRDRELAIEPDLVGEGQFENQLAHLTRERQMRIRGVLSGTVPLEGGSLHLTDMETGQEKGVVPDEHTLAIQVDAATAIARMGQLRAETEAARQAARDAEQDFVSPIDALEDALSDLDRLRSVDGISQEEYLAHLYAHLAGYERFSDEWFAITERITRVEGAAAKERARIAEEAAREQQRIREEQAEEHRRFAEEVTGAVTGAGDLVSEFRGEEDVTLQQVMAFLHKKLVEAREFRTLLDILVRKGYSDSIIEALATAGPESLQFAQALSRAKPAQVRTINRWLQSLGYQGAVSAQTAGRALGIPGFAMGGISRGGLALVGEQGPELVSLPAGAEVHRNGTGFAPVVNLSIHIAGSLIGEREVVEKVRDEFIRINARNGGRNLFAVG